MQESGSFAAVEHQLRGLVQWLQLAVEAAGALVVAIGVVLALIAFARAALRRAPERYSGVRLVLAHYLAVALELLLAADVLATAISPSWDQIGKLAAIAAIRTALNFFLTREMAQEEKEEAVRRESA